MATKPKAKGPAAAPGAKTVGQQLIDAVVPRYFPTLSALHQATGGSYSRLSNWKNGSKNPDVASIDAIAKLVGVHPMELITQRRSTTSSLRNHPEFRGALQRAKERFPRRVPDSAYERAADTYAAQWPAHIDEVFLFDLAQFWWKNAPDSEVMAAEEAEVRAEMDAADKQRR